MVDTTNLVIFTPSGMAAAFQFHLKGIATVPAFGAHEAEELAGHEVTGVYGYEMDESRFLVGLSEAFESRRFLVAETHREKISAVSSCPSSMRRSRSASPRG